MEHGQNGEINDDNGNLETRKFIFPKWSNKVPVFILVSITLLLMFVIHLFWYWLAPSHLEVGYEPEQPIPYSHRFHAGELGIDCRYCHYNVETQAHANIPSSELCLNCHSQIKQDSPYVKQIQDHYDNNTPVDWVNVHMLPEYVYFDHSRHVNSGVSCVQCHGRVDQMEVVQQVESLSMAWCLDCHRNPVSSIWPKEKVTNLSWEPDEDQLEMGERLIEEYHLNPKIECSVCHR
ncbi:cytochrome C [Candidatus Marinamargulisbacteria bacterium SCGC AG-333-B06]|nr:cytochrome C [Candidatus Marinamargulisbacteria bacterium SCGC AG-333-B06]